jgi:polar amino acid transport system substrate-binding protein
MKREKKQIGFTDAYLKNRQIIVIREGSDIKGKSDLSGKVVGLQMGSTSEEALNKDKDTVELLKEVKKFPNNTDALLDLKAERLDAVVVDEIVGRYYIAKKPGEYKVIEDNFGDEEYGVGYRKDDVSFGEELNKAINEMKNDGTADEISKKWFGEAIVTK